MLEIPTTTQRIGIGGTRRTISDDPRRFDKTALLSLVEQAGGTVKGSQISCFNHEDRHPSAGVYCNNGVWRYKCHSCGIQGDYFDISKLTSDAHPNSPLLNARFNRSESPDTFPTLDDLNASISWPIEDTYLYTDPASGKADMIVFRIRRNGVKSFLQARPTSTGFQLKAPGKPWPLYRRDKIAESNHIVVAEGEKAVKAFEFIGLTATTCPGGAGKARHADWRPLAGKRVTIWPDNDCKGFDHAREVAAILIDLAPAPRVFGVEVESLNMPDKGDIVDLLRLEPEYGSQIAREAVYDAGEIFP